ncbi:MAG: phosphate acyltransferase PlsX [Planctomycetota bacterium]
MNVDTKLRPTRVAVDAMGGDHAPDAIVKGVLLALDRMPEVSVDLVGDEAVVRPALEAAGGVEDDRLSIVHASEVLDMGENPVAGIKAKPDNSISRAVREVHEGRVSAVFSAGNTGGLVAASTLHLDRIRGVKRPGIAAPFPTLTGMCLIVDVGANINCRPLHLVHYAHMASAYAAAILGIEKPRVGMLNIGEEEHKGNSLVKETVPLLKESGLDFVGNVEGHQVFQGGVDVVVCEGFVGNMILKTSEGIASTILTMMGKAAKEMAASDPTVAQGVMQLLGSVKDRIDYAAYGGAPLLGFEGAVLIGHGRSEPEAVANAVRVAAEYVAADVTEKITEAVRATRNNSEESAA